MKTLQDFKKLQSLSTKKRENRPSAPTKNDQTIKNAIKKSNNDIEVLDKMYKAGELPSPSKILAFCTHMCEARGLSMDFISTGRNLAVLKAYVMRGDYIVSGMATSFTEYVKYLVDYWEFFCGSRYNKWMYFLPDVFPLYKIITFTDLQQAFHTFIRENRNKEMEHFTSVQYFKDRIIIEDNR